MFNDIRIDYPESKLAIADIRYRLLLITAENSLPDIEDAKEIYVLTRSEGNVEWKIKANHDHFVGFAPRNLDLG